MVAPGGACVAKGACMAKGGACVAKGVCMVKGGVHGEGGCAWQKGGIRGEGGMHGERGACMVCTPPTRYGRSLRGRYASYWNDFLFHAVVSVLELPG